MKKFFSLVYKKLSLSVRISVIFFVLCALSFLAFFIAKQGIKNSSQKEFQQNLSISTTEITLRTKQVLREYSSILFSARALFNSSQSVERDEWQSFVISQDLGTRYPAIKALEWADRVQASEVFSYTRSVRNDTSVFDNGYPDFKVHPESENEEFYVVNYIEPHEGNEQAMGLDFLTEESRRKSVELARDTNTIQMTDPLRPVQKLEGERAFVLILPVYEGGRDPATLQDRRESIEGLVILLVDAQQLFQQMMSESNVDESLILSAKDSTEGVENILASDVALVGVVAGEQDPEKLQFTQNYQLAFGGRTWKLSFYTTDRDKLSRAEAALPWIILFAGLIFSFFIAYSLHRSKRLEFEAKEIAGALTQDLVKFKLAMDNASDSITITDLQGVIVYANSIARSRAGTSGRSLVGKKSSVFKAAEADKNLYEEFLQVLKFQKKQFVTEFKSKGKNGKLLYSEASISPVLKGDGDAEFFVVIERDISKEKEIEKLNKFFVERELKMVQLKTELDKLKKQDPGKNA